MPEEKKDAHSRSSVSGKMQNSEEFAEYVHAVSIPMKIAMAAIAVFFAGVIAYCAFGRAPVSINVAVVADSSGACTCYIKESERDDVEPGDGVEVNGQTCQIATVSAGSICVDEMFDGYACKIGGFEIGDYVYVATLDCTLPQGVYSAVLTKDYLQPLQVLLAG